MKKSIAFLLFPIISISLNLNAQSYPAKPIRVIVAFSPGGANDLFARLIGQKLSENFKQNVLVENRPGAGGNIGSDFVSKSPPDGYTLLLGSTGPHAINPHIYKSMPYDSLRDFTPISLIATSSALLVIHPSIPARSVSQLIALSKKKNVQLNYASSGNGSSGHLAGELFRSMASINIQHIPYKGNGPAFTDLVSGNVEMMFANKPGALPYVNTEKLRAIAITSLQKDPNLPFIPTVAETLPGFEASTWWGLLGPAGLPADVTQRLAQAVHTAISNPDIQKRFVSMGADVLHSSPAQFSEQINKDYEKYGKLVKLAGMGI